MGRVAVYVWVLAIASALAGAVRAELPEGRKAPEQTPVRVSAGQRIHLLTNQHVVGDAKFVKVRLAAGRELLGEVLRSASLRDVALVKTDSVALAPLEMAVGEPRAGDDIYVFGSPLGDAYSSSVTRGIVSGMREVDRQRWVQSDVRVLPGSSGGPLVAGSGAVIGIAARGIAGLNLFIPIAEALSALQIEFRQP